MALRFYAETMAKRNLPHKDISPAALSKIARTLYKNISSLSATLQIWRPYVCPLGPIIEAVPVGAKVLDIGCGGGLFLGLLAHFDNKIEGVGFDASSKAIAVARIMAEHHPAISRLKFLQQDIDKNWPDGPFDVISMIDVLHHVPLNAQLDVFRKAVAHVKPGGMFLFKDIATTPCWRAMANQLHDLILAQQWVQHIPQARILEWAAESDLTLAGNTPRHINALWYAHEFMIFKKAA